MTEKQGKITAGLGGLFEVRCPEPDGSVTRYSLRAKGILRRTEEDRLLVGDNVLVTTAENAPDERVISALLARKNALIRPPVANLDLLFVILAARSPDPVFSTADKLISIAEYHAIAPIVVVTKADLSPDTAEEVAQVYRTAGFPVFVTSRKTGDGLAALHDYVANEVRGGRTAAFAGASGVGKSTLMNALFPALALPTGEVSRKTERGRHTTRAVELYETTPGAPDTGFLADTPGFSLLDFERFDFFPAEALPATFREFAPYLGVCRYADCTHTGEGEADCAVARAAEEGKIPPSRLSSYRDLFRTLKNKNPYK